MRLLIPNRDKNRFERNTKLYEEYRRMLDDYSRVSENQINTRLAAKYDISVSMVRKIIEQYRAEYPSSKDIGQDYFVKQ